jgi:hypothetical protein
MFDCRNDNVIHAGHPVGFVQGEVSEEGGVQAGSAQPLLRFCRQSDERNEEQ